MKILTKEQIIALHDALIKEHGGTNELRDEGLLDSASSTPYQTFGGVDLYPSIVEKAGRLGYGLIKNHPFVDGNKRIGTHAMLVLLVIGEKTDYISLTKKSLTNCFRSYGIGLPRL